jgi:serine protease Do
MKLNFKIHACTSLIALLFTAVSTAVVAQSPEPKLNDPLGRRWFEEQRPERSPSLTLSSMEALAIENEKEALAKFSKSSPDFEHMFDDVVADARRSLAVVRSKGLSRSPKARKRAIALGTVVSADGLVLTKASELKGNLYCEFASGDVLAAELIGLDTENDLALLKTDASGLFVGDFGESNPIETGDWVATALDHAEEIEVGVVSVDPRFIAPSKPFIGIYMSEAKPTGIMVLNVQEESPADEGGLKVRDVILKLDDQLVKDIGELRKSLEQYDAGDLVTLSILRNDKPKKVKLTLAERDKVSSENMRSNQQNSMGSRLSRRRKDFPLAFQHDTALQAAQCGGPIVDLDGKIVGINIARAGRVSSLAIPIAEIVPIVERLSTGEYSPVVVNAQRIEKVQNEIEETQKLTRELSRKLDLIEEENEAVLGTRRGLEIAAQDIQKRLDAMLKTTQKQDAQRKDANSELNRLERLMRELKKDHERLATGLKY